METILLTSGLNALQSAINTTTPVRLGSFKLGSSYNYTLSASSTNISGTQVTSGSAAYLRYFKVTDDEYHYIIRLDHDYEDALTWGNAMLFLDDATPFMAGVNVNPVYKTKTSGAERGHIHEIYFPLHVPSLSSSLSTSNLNELVTNFVEVNSFTDIDVVAYRETQVIAEDTGVNNTTYCFKDNRTRSWWGSPLNQKLDDPNYGSIDGGLVGQGWGNR